MFDRPSDGPTGKITFKPQRATARAIVSEGDETRIGGCPAAALPILLEERVNGCEVGPYPSRPYHIVLLYYKHKYVFSLRMLAYTVTSHLLVEKKIRSYVEGGRFQ